MSLICQIDVVGPIGLGGKIMASQECGSNKVKQSFLHNIHMFVRYIVLYTMIGRILHFIFLYGLFKCIHERLILF